MIWLDNLLNKVTMYRLTIYILAGLLSLAEIFSWFGWLHYSAQGIVATTAVLIIVCWWGNKLFAWAFGAPTHSDSSIITALILALIVPPSSTVSALVNVAWVGLLAVAGKYIIAWERQHLFNPAALAVAVTGATISFAASWWVGQAILLPFVAIGGYLLLHKLEKEAMVGWFLLTALGATIVTSIIRHTSIITGIHHIFMLSPIVFFATVMVTEPATMPGRRSWRYAYMVIIAILATPQIHFGRIYSTPELALLSGNFLGFLVQSRQRYRLTLVRIEEAADGVRDFIFRSDRPVQFIPGQYVELMNQHPRCDARGQRRYFTVASAPSEMNIRFGVKFYPQASSFKMALWNLRPGQSLVASQLGGDFVLPKNKEQPLVFIAGGIGVTPFRSMVAELLARRESRSMTLFYSVANPSEIAYGQTFADATQELGLQFFPTVTNPATIPSDWTGLQGVISPEMIQQNVPNWRECRYYLSGPHGMVKHFQKVLRQMSVPGDHIVTDFFPGFA